MGVKEAITLANTERNVELELELEVEVALVQPSRRLLLQIHMLIGHRRQVFPSIKALNEVDALTLLLYSCRLISRQHGSA